MHPKSEFLAPPAGSPGPQSKVALTTVPPLDDVASAPIRSAVPADEADEIAATIETIAQDEAVETGADEKPTPAPSDEASVTDRQGIVVSGVLVIPEGWPDGIPGVSAHRVGDRTGNDVDTGLLSDPESVNGALSYQWTLLLPQGGAYEFWSEDPPHV